MKSKKIRVVVATLVVSMLASLLPNVTYANGFETPVEAVKALTEENRSLIPKIEPQGSFVIDPDIYDEPSDMVKVIVELKEPSVAEIMDSNIGSRSVNQEQQKVAQKEKIEIQHEDFKQKVNNIFTKKKANNENETSVLSEIKILDEYAYTFNGVSMEIPKGEVETLLETGIVKRIWLDRIVEAPQPVEMEETKESIGLPAPLPHLGVDKLHGEGVTGEGVKVAVLDTGIDYNHPDLKDSYKGGYDFVDEDDDPMETTYEDWLNSNSFEMVSGSYYYTSHGTHVSGTIAANPRTEVDYAMTGVAPNVDLYAYRVLGPYGRGETSDIISAIEYSVEQKMDVINLSLGSSYNTSLDATAIAINNIAKLGVVPCVAAGNSGEGVGTLGSPGTSPLAITVGASSVPTDCPTTDLNLGDITVNAELLASNFGGDEKLLANQEYELVDVGGGDGLWAKDVKGKIAIAKLSYMNILEIIRFAKNEGAAGIIICNSEDSDIPYFFGEDVAFVPAFGLTKSEGDALLEQLKANPEGKLYINELSENIYPGDYLAPFSSRGPVLNNYDIKPEVVAPGVNIMSTYPGFMNARYEGGVVDYKKAYSASNGTSMATPHVAGVAALILQAHPEYDVADVKAALANTAEPLAEEYNVFESGAGRVNAYEAVHTDNLVQIMDKVDTIDENGQVVEMDNISSTLRFGQIYESSKDESKTLEVKISNFSDKEENYNVSVEFLSILNSAGTVLDAAANGVILNIPDTITVGANQQGSLNATINIPTIAQQGLYQGYVYFTNAENSEEEFKVPFAVRHSDKGFDYVYTSRIAASNDFEKMHPNFSSSVSAAFKLNSPMKYMDIVLSKVDGEVMGFISLIDATNIAFDVQYALNNFFRGEYLPILSDTELGKSTLVPEGEYEVSFVATGVDGDVYEVVYPLFIDNTKPEITFDENRNPGLYEISEENLTVDTDINGNTFKGLWFTGNIYDSTIARLLELGYTKDGRGKEISQSFNTISIQKNYNYIKDIVKPDKNGDFKFGIKMEELDSTPLSAKLSYYDHATAGNLTPEEIFVVREDQSYTSVSYDNNEVKLNETVTATVSVNNAKDFVKGTFRFDISETNYEYNVKLSDEFIKTVEEAGGTVELKKPAAYWPTYEVIVEGTSVSGDLDVIELEAKVISDKYWDGKVFFLEDNRSSYENSQGTTANLKTYSEGFNLISKTSMLMVNLACIEGLDTYPGFNYYGAGIKVWIEDEEGKKYEPTRINYVGMAQIENIPAEGNYTLSIDVPGHFSYSTPIAIHEENESGEKVGIYKMWFPETILAGDINRDNVIDIKDALYIVDNYLTTNREADIYFDNVVNNYDMYYVIQNYGVKNPLVADAPEATFEKDGIVLEDITADLEDEIANIRLERLIDKVKGLDEKVYTEETWKVVKKALNNAVAVNENKESTQEEINTAKVTLQEAFNGLVKAVVKTHLQLAVTEAEKIGKEELDRVVPVVAKEFKEALKEAQKILKDKKATQEEVDNSWERLSSVMQKLSFYKGDKTNLMALMDEILKLDGEEFFKGPWDKLQLVLVEAQAVVDNENAMEKEVNEIYEKLMKAFLDLRLLPNKDILEDLINKAEGLDKEVYTEETWNALVEALKEAKEVFANREVEEEDVKKAEEGLQLAMERLQEKDDNNGDGNGDGNGNGNNGGGNNNGNGNKPDTGLPQTGGLVGGGLLTMVGAIAATTGIAMFKRRKIS